MTTAIAEKSKLKPIDLRQFTKQTSLLDLKKALTPGEYASFLRSQGKIFYWDAARFYVVSDFELAKEVLKNPAFSADRSSFFISRMPDLDLSLIGDFFAIIRKMMVMSDGRAHEERRKAAALGIDGELLEYFKPLIDATVDRLLTAAEKNGVIEFAKDVAEPLPWLVLADLFAIDPKDRAEFYQASLTMTQFFGGAATYDNETGHKVNAAAVFIRGYFQELIEKRRHKPEKDFFSILLANQEKFGLSDDEILAQAVMMLVAGQVTTTDQLCNNMFTLIDTGAAVQLRTDPALLPTAIEEFNRLDPGVTYVFRTVKQPITLGGIDLSPEDVVFVSTHAVNRDPVAFESPDECLLHRRVNPHFAYGHGPHFCLGARLARLQMHSLFKRVLERFPRLDFDAANPPARNHYALSFSGFHTIHLTTKQ